MAKIVLVDDHADSREVVRQLLEAKGHSIICCETAEEALAAIEREAPDAVITDQRLPGMSGLDLLGVVRSRSLPVRVILTSADDTRRDEALAAGAWGFWLKGSDAIFDGIDALEAKLNHSAG